MKRGALIFGMALVSTVAFSRPLSIEAYNPANKRAEAQKPGIVPVGICLYSDREIGSRRAKPKREEGYKPMPLKDGEPGGARKPEAVPLPVGSPGAEKKPAPKENGLPKFYSGIS